MSLNAVELRPRTIGEVIGVTFSLYRTHFLTFLGIAAVVAVPGLILSSLGSLTPVIQGAIAPQAFIDPGADLGDVGGLFAALGFASMCLTVLTLIFGVLWPLMEGALTHSAIETMLGRAPSIGASYGEARKRWGALWGSNLLAQLLIGAASFVGYILFAGGLGMVGAVGMAEGDGAAQVLAVILSLLCLPILLVGLAIALVLSVLWAFRAPAVIGEGADSFQALARSGALTRRDRFRLVGRYLVLVLIEFFVLGLPALLIAAVLAVGALLTPGRSQEEALRALIPTLVGGSVLALALAFIGTLLLVPLRAIFNVVNYFDMRIRKENLAAALAQGVPAPAEAAPEAVVIPAAPAAQPAPVAAAPGAAASIALTPLVPAAPLDAVAHAPPQDLAALSPGQRVGVLFNRVRYEGENPQLLNDLGLAYADLGDYGGALDALTRARALAPRDADIAFNLAQVHLGRKDVNAAREMLQEYLRLETDPAEVARVRETPRFQQLLASN